MNWVRQVFSRDYSHKDFCLAHLFTDIRFEGGILGLAYVGSPRRNSVGGICTPGTAVIQGAAVQGKAVQGTLVRRYMVQRYRVHCGTGYSGTTAGYGGT